MVKCPHRLGPNHVLVGMPSHYVLARQKGFNDHLNRGLEVKRVFEFLNGPNDGWMDPCFRNVTGERPYLHCCHFSRRGTRRLLVNFFDEALVVLVMRKAIEGHREGAADACGKLGVHSF